MDILDVPTIWITSVFSIIFCTVIMFCLWYLNRNIKGSLYWFIAMLSFSACLIFLTVFSLIGYSRVTLLSFLVKECTLIGYIFTFIGTRQFFGLSKYNRPLLGILLLSFSLLLLNYIYIVPDESKAMILMCIACILIFSLTFLSIIYGYLRLPYDERCFTGSVFLSIVLVATIPKDFYQILLIVSEPLQSQFAFSLLNIILSFFAVYLPMLLLVSFAILCNEHKENNLKRLHKEAKEHVALRSRFLAVMSHEMRTPLNGIMGMAQLMQASYYNDGIQSDCQVIVNSSEMLNDLANNVLDYSKLDFQDIPLDEEDKNLAAFIDDIFLLLRPIANTKPIELLINLDNKLHDFYVFDYKKLRQVLVNLIGNAIKFTNTGEVRLSIDLHSRGKSADNILFSVQDTGIGIPENEQDKLLQPFSQASNAANQFSGTGLGLAISNKLLGFMKTKLLFFSRLNIGSHFYFTLQLPIGNGELAALAESKKLHDYVTGLTILLVEDLPLNQKIAIAFLAQDKHKVTLANNKAQALMLANSNKYDLILLDINLPDGTGTALCLDLTINKGLNANTPIAAMTARVAEQDIKLYEKVGMPHVVVKPIKQSQLRAVIYQCIHKKAKSTLSSFTEQAINTVVFDDRVLNQLALVTSADEFDNILFQLPEQFEMFWSKTLTALEQRDIDILVNLLHSFAAVAAQLGFMKFHHRLLFWERHNEPLAMIDELGCLSKLKKSCAENCLSYVQHHEKAKY